MGSGKRGPCRALSEIPSTGRKGLHYWCDDLYSVSHASFCSIWGEQGDVEGTWRDPVRRNLARMIG